MISKVELGELPSVGLRVCEVDGGAVRTYLNAEFALAGNPGRYSMIPADELWVDRCLSPADAAATIVHEAIEYGLILGGTDYEQAHEAATGVELPMRLAMAGEDCDGDPVEFADAWLASRPCAGA